MDASSPEASPDAVVAVDAAPAADADAAVIEDTGVAPSDTGVGPFCGPDASRYSNASSRCYRANPAPDGGAPAPSRCSVSVGADALAKTGAVVDGNGLVIPSGRRVRRASDRLELPGFPMAMLRIPGTSFVVVTDGGIRTETLRVIDLSAPTLRVVAGGEASFPREDSARSPALFYGLAFNSATRTLYASGGGSNRIYAFTMSAAGALTMDTGRTIDLGITEGGAEGRDSMTGALAAAYPAGIALSDDGATLYAALQRGHELAVLSTATRSIVRTIAFPRTAEGGAFPYVVERRPGDARRVYVSLWGQGRVVEVDVEAGSILRSFDVGKNPSEISFSDDGARMTVVASDSDAVSTVDLSLMTPTVRRHYLGGSASAARGLSPTAFATARDGTLYVALADDNAIEVLAPGTFDRIGRIPTEWYPTDVALDDRGNVIVTTGKGLGSGPSDGSRELIDIMTGSIARYPAPTMESLRAGDVQSRADNLVRTSFNRVECPMGVEHDFVIPPVGSRAGSPHIRHVVMIVRENKTYDAVLGDYAGRANAADGDGDLTIVPRDRMPVVFPNLRALVERFANHDNYYSNAEQSIQGHVWATQGRTTDYTERSWLTTWGRATRGIPTQATSAVGIAEEGTLFTAMARARVRAEVWGELVGRAEPDQLVGTRYPGVGYNYSPDIRKAFAFTDPIIGANRNRNNPSLQCSLPSFSYILLPNDHTEGGRPGRPTPASHIQDNDEATGFIIDTISHSALWPHTLVIVIEDDPQDGGDHVDNHRSIAVLASPWVRPGYTSHVHYDESSLHHTIELILGMAPHNQAIASAAPMYDAFSTTPDYRPFDYVPRRECEVLNAARQRYAQQSEAWDWSLPDNQPGLSRMVWRMLRGSEPPWTEREGDDDDDD